MIKKVAVIIYGGQKRVRKEVRDVSRANIESCQDNKFSNVFSRFLLVLVV